MFQIKGGRYEERALDHAKQSSDKARNTANLVGFKAMDCASKMIKDNLYQ